MKASQAIVPESAAENIISLNPQPAPKRTGPNYKEPFKIVSFQNPRTGTWSWRVSGFKRDGTRIRENFQEQPAAECRKSELTLEWLARQTETQIRATKLTDLQLRIAESAFLRLDSDEEMPLAIDHWIQHGRQRAVAESPRLDEAADSFIAWLDHTESLRDRTKDKLRHRINVFRNSVPNVRVADVTPDAVDKFLSGRDVSALTKIGDRQAISRFFSWCIDRPRRWVAVNPCREIKIERKGDSNPPAILSVDECQKFLKAALEFKHGQLLPYISVCLFGGLRPAEAQRLTWEMVNLVDGEIRVESQSTKTKKPRVVRIDKTLRAWLEEAKSKPFCPPNLRKSLDYLKQAAGYTGRLGANPGGDLKPWPHDVMRHTAISHFFRQSGSYGLTAEQFGNSESIIKQHYQGRVTSDDTKQFYALRPGEGKNEE